MKLRREHFGQVKSCLSFKGNFNFHFPQEAFRVFPASLATSGKNSTPTLYL